MARIGSTAVSADIRNPRVEAQAMMPPGFVARVLEPSPPAVHDGEFADDPTDRSDVATGTTVVSPVATADRTWVEFTDDQPHLQGWARQRWLGPWPRLAPLPVEFVQTRDALHQLAYFVLAPARHRANTKIGLRPTMGGFGTPFFGDDIQLRIDGPDLVVQDRDSAKRSRLTTITLACERFGITYRPDWFPRFSDPLSPMDPREPLMLAAPATAAAAALFGFGGGILEELRATAPTRDKPSQVQLWPEHFDLAVDLGNTEAGARASVGISLGDASHPEPYLYVSAWGEIDRSNPIWNDPNFNGASLAHSEFVDSDDQREAALSFYRRVRLALDG